MTNRKILQRLEAADNGHDADDLRRLRADLADDVYGEKAPRQPVDDWRHEAMTKREMLDRLKQTAGYSGDDGRFAFDAHRLDWLQFRAFLRALVADVQAEETPRKPEDMPSKPIRSFDDACRRVEMIRDMRIVGITDTALSEMLGVLCDDLTDAHAYDNRSPTDVKPDPRQPGPVPFPAPTTAPVKLTLRPGQWVVIGMET